VPRAWPASRYSPRRALRGHERLYRNIRGFRLCGCTSGANAFQSNKVCVTAKRAQNTRKGRRKTELDPAKLLRPSSPRLIFEAATYGAAFTCGKSALNCSSAGPRAERMSASESNTPRFCLSPRSIAALATIAASLPERAFRHATSEGAYSTGSRNGLAGVLGLDVVRMCVASGGSAQ